MPENVSDSLLQRIILYTGTIKPIGLSEF